MWFFKKKKPEPVHICPGPDRADQFRLSLAQAEASRVASQAEALRLRISNHRTEWIQETAKALLLDRDGFTWENALVAARRIYDGAAEPKGEAKT